MRKKLLRFSQVKMAILYARGVKKRDENTVAQSFIMLCMYVCINKVLNLETFEDAEEDIRQFYQIMSKINLQI